MADQPPQKPKFNLGKYITETQLYKSMFRHGYSTSERDRALSVMTNVFFHLHPVKVRKSGVPFGIMRELHRWGAHAMIITVWLHMFRVFMTGSYKPPREFNWIIGVILLVLTMLLSFTGYLLPWDQLAMWAVTVGSNMARAAPLLGHGGPFHEVLGVNPVYDARAFLFGGAEIGPHTLLRFYILHCIFFPLLATIFMAVHFWRIRRDGMSGPL